jgi:hypothetical protein
MSEKTTIKEEKPFSAGWIGSSVALIIIDVQILKQFSLSLITSLDSETELAASKIGREIVNRYSECRFLGSGIVVPSNLLAGVNNEMKLFHGFDEVWFFDTLPAPSKPHDVSLVAPLNLSKELLPLPVIHWMQSSNCGLGIGDGIGLNYVTADEKIAKQFEKF